MIQGILFLSILLSSLLFSDPMEEKAMVVVIPSYNNSKWCSWNVSSVLGQEYSNFRVIYIDDSSFDQTANKVEALVRKHKGISINKITFDDQKSKDILKITAQFEQMINQNPAFFSLIINKNRAGALANFYRSISSCLDEEIIVVLDGDDWFPDFQILKKLNEVYQNTNIWLSHGSMIEYPSGSNTWSEPIPPSVIAKNTFRNFKCPTHLRTFYAWLFKKIRLDDLLYNGEFFSMTHDMATMYPMIEMCGERHAFISTPTYVYNMSNPINDNKVNAELQRTLDRYIRQKKPYENLEKR